MSSSLTTSKSITLYVDADACPVKQEIYRVAERHTLKGVALKVFPGARPDATFAGRARVVSNSKRRVG